MPKPEIPANKSVALKRTSKHKRAKPVSRVILSPVMRYDNPGQLTVPNHLNFGNDGKLYLTHGDGTKHPKAEPQLISLKESVAWFRLGYDYNLNVTKDAGFGEWLRMVERELP